MSYLDILGYFVLFIFLVVCFYIYIQENENFQLKCVVSDVDGNKYCVREREKIDKAADLLSSVCNKCKDLVDYVYNKYPERENVKRLKMKFNPERISEILPTSSYTAYSENKGEKLAFCLSSKDKKDNDNLIDEHTLTFVAIHELSHIASESIGHKTEFWENFKFLLEEAEEAGIHKPIDYKKEEQEYCGMTIRDNPYYDM